EGSNFCGTCGAPLRSDPGEDTTVVTFALETEGEGEEEFSVPMDELEEGKAIVVVGGGRTPGPSSSSTRTSSPAGATPPATSSSMTSPSPGATPRSAARTP